MAEIVLIGDYCPTDGVEGVKIDEDVLRGDLVVGNLEAPIADGLPARPKAGPALAGEAAALAALPGGKVVLSLANNHAMDFGWEGVCATRETCSHNGLEVVGVGEHVERALDPVIRMVGGVRVGILACAESQFGMATAQTAGVAPFAPARVLAAIRDLCPRVDHVVVSVHGGAELCAWPSPEWRDLMRGCIDAGASIVHGHHSHVPQGYEVHGCGLIFYGLGNFLVDPERWRGRDNALWSLVARVELTVDGIRGWGVEPCVIDEAMPVRVRVASGDEREACNTYLAKANRPLDDEGMLTGLWQEVAVRTFRKWHGRWLGFVGWTDAPRLHKQVRALGVGLCRTLQHKPHGYERVPGRDDLLTWYHLFACESHRNTIRTALGVLGGELPDLRTEALSRWVDEMMPWSCNMDGME